MVNELKRIVVILTPLVIIAVYVGQKMTPDAAAVVGGLGAGLLFAGVLAVVGLVWKDNRDARERRNALMERRRARQVEHPVTPSQQWIEGEWREVRDPKQIAEPAGRALVPYNTTTKEVA